MRILVVEDERRLSDSIKKGLTEAGLAVDQAFDGEEGLWLANSESYDCVILDLMLPKLDGLIVCKKLRESNNDVPILMLTARGTVEDIANGLDTGADDYLPKPFSFVELRSRVQAIIRRSHNQASPVIKLADLELDEAKHEVRIAGKSVILTPKEFAILEFLMRHKGETVTRTMITEHVWDYGFDSMSNVVDVYITSLRKKIGRYQSKKLIHTVHGVGFKASEDR